MREQNVDKINAKYLQVSRSLEQAGVKAIVICANTPHMAYDYVQPKIGIPILHIADATGKEAARLQLKRVGLLGNKPTMTRGFIPDILLRNYGIDTIIPEENDLAQSHHYVSKELTQGLFTKEATTFFLEQIQSLKNRGAEGIILGCTELPILLDKSSADIPLLATTQLHAQMAVDFILG